jgi:excinuclease ABC subunit C
MVASVLEGIAGLGPTRQARLLETFGSLKAIRALPRERLYQESWLPNSVADALYDQLHPEFQPPLIKREGVFDD